MVLKFISHSVYQQVYRQAAVYQSHDNANGFAKFQVLTEVLLKIHVYCNFTSCWLAISKYHSALHQRGQVAQEECFLDRV